MGPQLGALYPQADVAPLVKVLQQKGDEQLRDVYRVSSSTLSLRIPAVSYCLDLPPRAPSQSLPHSSRARLDFRGIDSGGFQRRDMYLHCHH